MKLKDEFKKLPKEMVFDMYSSIVYDWKSYDNITRTKMLDEIIKEYKQEKFVYAMCTKRELEFLKYITKNKLKENDLEKYKWEIKTLNQKCILSNVTYEIFEEQKDNVESALKYYEEHPRYNTYEIITFMISLVKINGILLEKALIMMINSMFNIEEEKIENLTISPLFRFYCDFDREYVPSLQSEETTIYYRKYFDILDDLEEDRKKYGMGGTRQIDLDEYFDMFYYDFPIKKPKVKKMIDLINTKYKGYDFFLDIIEDARVTYFRDSLEYIFKDKDDLKIINEGLDECPCAAMNGFTPNEWKKNKAKSMNIKFSSIPQINAHLCKKDADLFYKLYFALLEYTNDKYKINKDVDRIYKQEAFTGYELKPINEYLWTHIEIIDDFIKENKYDFNDEELDIIDGFKTAIYSDTLAIVGFDREYTEVLDIEKGKLYMIKGVRVNIDEIVDSKLPIIIETGLLMFKDKIIFNSFLFAISTEIDFGTDFNSQIFEDKEKAIKYYHL